MPFSEHLLKFIAARFGVPSDAMEFFFASGHIGNGAETLLPFPAELIPIGARLALRGWLNQAFLPANPDWILPYWAERQFDPRNPEFQPHGLNLYTLNYSHRDWTMVGTPGAKREALVDPRGLVTPWFGGWSLDVWIGKESRLIAPSRLPDGQVEQSLDQNLPIVLTTFQVGGLRVRCQVFAVEEDGSWVIETITVDNPTSAPQRGTLYLAARPFNPEGVGLIKHLEYSAEQGRAVFFIDNAPGVLLPAADAVACSNMRAGDVALALPSLNGRMQVSDQSGLATGVAAYNIDLTPRASRIIVARMPMERVERDEEEDEFPGIPPAIASESGTLGQVVSDWTEKLKQGLQVQLPDEQMQSAFEANKAFLLALHDGDSITPGPLTYHQFWFRDAAYMLNALDKVGYHQLVRQVIEKYPRRLEKDGYLRATEGEWDSNGAAIWTIVENARLSGDMDLLARDYWPLLRMASWINSKRQKTKDQKQPHSLHHGLLPSGPSAEHLGPSDYFYWDDWWGLAGLRDTAQAATWLGQEGDAKRLGENYALFRKDVEESLARVAELQGRLAMPAAPDRRLDFAAIANLAALYPLHLFAPDDPRIVDTLAALKEKATINGAYFNREHSAFGTYLALHIAECYLYQRNPEALNIIRWVLDHASPTWTWAEGLNPITLRGGMGDGQHGWALADFLVAVRNLLLFEEEDHLVLTPVLPVDWTAENSVIKVEDAPTYFGPVSYTIAFGDRTGTLVLKGDWRKAPAYIEWDLPFPLREVGGDVESISIVDNRVRLPQGERSAQRVVAMW